MNLRAGPDAAEGGSGSGERSPTSGHLWHIKRNVSERKANRQVTEPEPKPDGPPRVGILHQHSYFEIRWYFPHHFKRAVTREMQLNPDRAVRACFLEIFWSG